MTITPMQMEERFLERICLGNNEAKEFLVLWNSYVHAIDDIEDEKTTPEFRLQAFILPLKLYTHPFFKANEQRLGQIVLNCTNAYADCVAWEKSETDWKREFVDHYRHFGCEMALAVASIVGGYENMRSVSLEFRTACWIDHHTKEGEQK